jgi:elongation factor Ts
MKSEASMTIKASDVKALRIKTGAGMMDCKKALMEAGGDFNKANEILKALGAAAAGKRSSRSTKEGRVFSSVQGQKGVLLELSCETDFVARNKDFVRLGENLIATILKEGGKRERLEEQIKEAIGRIKENMALRRFQIMEADDSEFLTDYIHDEGKIGVLVKAGIEDPALKQDKRVTDIANDFALHVTAFPPLFMSQDTVDPEYLEKKEEQFRVEAEKLNKPPNIREGIVKGKMRKHLIEVCLFDQGFVRDEKVKCSDILSNFSKEIGSTFTIKEFLYYKAGEEI